MTTQEPEGPLKSTTELVALRLQSGPDLVRRVFQAWDKGLAVLPLDPSLPDEALRRLLDSLRPSRLVTASGETALDGRPVDAETAVVVATSGTSKEPKGVELSHRALDWSARASVTRLGAAADGRWLCCLPLHHIAGLMVVMRARLKGDLPVIHDRFDTAAITGETRARLISLVPAALARLLEADADLSRFSAILLGGGPVGEEILEKAAEKGANVITTYGMTETCGGCVYDGVPLEGVAVRISSEQILLAGPMLFTRYRLRPDLTQAAFQDGWFHTADRGKLSAEGRLQVLGRLDDVIITGGKKVSAGDLEQHLTQHPSIKEAAVVGLPSKQWGQEIAAALVLHPTKNADLEDLRDFIAEKAPRWAAPKRILPVASLPRNSTGKVLRGEVARLFEK